MPAYRRLVQQTYVPDHLNIRYVSSILRWRILLSTCRTLVQHTNILDTLVFCYVTSVRLDVEYVLTYRTSECSDVTEQDNNVPDQLGTAYVTSVLLDGEYCAYI